MNQRSTAEAPGTERFRLNGTSKRSASKARREVTPVVPEVSQAPFAIAAAQPIDAPMWSIHPGVWFQPDRPPVFAGSGLELARKNRLPAGDFAASVAASPIDCAATRETPVKPLSPAASPAVPASDLAPLGWDPRTVCRKGGAE